VKNHSSQSRKQILRRYGEHLGQVAGLAPKTCQNHSRDIGDFLEAVPIANSAGLATLTPVHVTSYLTAQSAHYQPASLRQVAASLRRFLLFAQQQGWINQPLSLAIPAIACRVHQGLPQYLSEPQLELLLDSWDLSTAQGLRDLAIGLCLARLGLRAGEVAALCLEDLDWRHGVLRLKQSKTGQPAELPLVREVGESIANYLRSGRPVCADRQVFLRHHPVGPMSRQVISAVIKRALGQCGLHIPRPGAHLLRHTLASHLVQNGATLKQVADLLRHRHLNSAAVYAHVDVTRLRTLAHPWPQEATV
jgi:site-specific recombinase XerD